MAASNGRALRRPLDRYERHAQRFGTEMVWETAAGLVGPEPPDLTVRELGALSLYLQRIDPAWRLPKGENDKPFKDADKRTKSPGSFEVRRCDRLLFALDLIAAGWKREHARAAAQISRSTLQRELRKSARPPKWAPGAASASQVAVSNRPRVGDGTRTAGAAA